VLLTVMVAPSDQHGTRSRRSCASASPELLRWIVAVSEKG
jgi:hypothetical protein